MVFIDWMHSPAAVSSGFNQTAEFAFSGLPEAIKWVCLSIGHLAIQESVPVTALDYCLQCFDAVGWSTGRASGL